MPLVCAEAQQAGHTLTGLPAGLTLTNLQPGKGLFTDSWFEKGNVKYASRFGMKL